MTKIEKLDWDSSFFSLNIGRIQLSSNDNLDSILNSAKDHFDLLYGFGNKNTILDPIKESKLIDTKVVFNKKLKSNKQKYQYPIQEYTSKKSTKTLIDLALESGKYSRFYRDKRFTKDQFIKLYTRWIENTLNKKFGDHIITISIANEIVGICTIKLDQKTAQVGLIAIDNKHQGKGLGSQLLTYVENFLFDKNIEELNIPTQLENKEACGFYAKNNYTIVSTEKIYHFWLK